MSFTIVTYDGFRTDTAGGPYGSPELAEVAARELHARTGAAVAVLEAVGGRRPYAHEHFAIGGDVPIAHRGLQYVVRPHWEGGFEVFGTTGARLGRFTIGREGAAWVTMIERIDHGATVVAVGQRFIKSRES